MNKLVIELGGKERTLKFNNIFLREYQKKQKEDTDEIMQISLMIWAGMKAYSEVSETPLTATFEDACDWGEDMILNNDTDTMNKILNAFQESNVYKAGQEVKKKMEETSQQTGMPLSDMPLES
jgi:hypothetical protein